MNPRHGGAAALDATVPDWLRGLWRRRSIAWADGRVDTGTTVYWLQSERAFADIRIPAERPDMRGRDRLEQLAGWELLALARQGGFAGWTELHGDVCRWHRTIDFQPPSGVPDEGRLYRRSDGTLIEVGVHEPYIEVWERAMPGAAAADVGRVALPARPGGRGEILLRCGDAFLFARDRAAALPPAASLEALLRKSGARRAASLDLLDCEISFGTRWSGRLAWEITLSTLPFRQGRALRVGGAPEVLDGRGG